MALSTSYHTRFPRLTLAVAASLGAIGLWRLVMILAFSSWHDRRPFSWKILFSLATVSVGAVWSAFWVFAMLSDGLVPATNLALMATVGIASAGVSTLVPSRTVMTTFLVLMMLPLAVVTALAGTPEQYAIALMLVAGMLELLQTTRLTARQRSFAENIHGSAEVLLRVIDEVLDFSKLEADRLLLEEVHFDLEEAVEGAANLLAQRAAEKDLELLTEIPDGVETRLRGDPAAIRRREQEAGDSRLPIIALTAHVGEGARDRALAAGMDEYLCKPFEMNDLRDVLERCVGARHG